MQEVKFHNQMTAQAFKYIKYMKLPEMHSFCIYKILELLRCIIFPGISLMTLKELK